MGWGGVFIEFRDLLITGSAWKRPDGWVLVTNNLWMDEWQWLLFRLTQNISTLKFCFCKSPVIRHALNYSRIEIFLYLFICEQEER
jgi:hypothetical protein